MWWVLCAICAFTTSVNAGTVLLEAGPFAIIMDEEMEIYDFGDLESWKLIGFEPITSRELIKDNYYNLKIGSVLVDDEAGLVSKYPTSVEISETPSGSFFLFTPTPVKEVTVGKLRPINTTLYTGNFTTLSGTQMTPYFVNFSANGIYCTVYEPNTHERSMIEFLENFDVIWKEDLGTYELAKLWSED